MTETMFPNMFGWDYRRPTVEEFELVERDDDRALLGFGPGEEGDSVVVTGSNAVAQVALSVAFEEFGLCSEAHVVPDGVYLEGLSESP